MSLILKFDPWRSSLCTCPPKLTFNPYTGCDHSCVYCYASSYIPKFHECRPKNDLLPRLKEEAKKLRGETLSIANSSDPYPNRETENGLTRHCLEILCKSDCKIQIITKSTIVQRDIDLLKKACSMVAVTVTTLDDGVAKLIEPQAPPSTARIKTIETLVDNEIPVATRIDPIILGVNDDAEGLVKNLASIGVRHITSSTYKARPDNWKRLSSALPEIAKKLEPLYFDLGKRSERSMLLPRQVRLDQMTKMRLLADKYAMRFGVCREGLSQLNTASCDGSWLLINKN